MREFPLLRPTGLVKAYRVKRAVFSRFLVNRLETSRYFSILSTMEYEQRGTKRTREKQRVMKYFVLFI